MRRNLGRIDSHRLWANRVPTRLAFSLVEMLAVLAIVGLLAGAAAVRFGSHTVDNLSAEGFSRRLALDLIQARRRTISTGDNHYLAWTPSAAAPTAYRMYRRASGGDVAVDQQRAVPPGLSVSSSHATLEYDFDGSSLAAYSVSVSSPDRNMTVSTVMSTGSVRVTP